MVLITCNSSAPCFSPAQAFSRGSPLTAQGHEHGSWEMSHFAEGRGPSHQAGCRGGREELSSNVETQPRVRRHVGHTEPASPEDEGIFLIKTRFL